MRHRKRTIKLGRTAAHRDALMASLVCELILEGRIKTTVPKAKAARRLAERMVTFGKKGTLAARRHAVSKLRRKDVVAVLFDKVAPIFTERAGGYTRIIRVGRRTGDNSETAILEWVEQVAVTKEPQAAAEKSTKKSATEKSVVEEKPSNAEKPKKRIRRRQKNDKESNNPE